MKMKNMLQTIRRRGLAVGCSLAFLLSCCVPVSAASSPNISLPSSANAYFEGFTTVRTMQVKCTKKTLCLSPAKVFYNLKGKTFGTVHTYIGRYRSKKKVDHKNYDALLIKVNVEPESFKISSVNNKHIKWTFYAYTDDLKLTATLPSGCVMQNSSPNNDTTLKESYTAGISGGASSGGVNAGASASVSMSSSICSISDNSSVKKHKFNIDYDYRLPGFIKTGSAKKEWTSTLFNSTWQVASVEWTTCSKKAYNVNINVEASFGIASAKSVNIGPMGHTQKASAVYKNHFKADQKGYWKTT